MAKTTKQLQAELVNDGFLDKLGNDPTDFASVGELPTVERFMIKSAALFIQNIKDELNRKGKVASGGIEDGISEGALTKDSNGYEITIGWDKSDPASKYYDFVNKGVSGFEKGEPGSPYSFKKKLNKKGGILIGAAMQKSLLRWYQLRGTMGSREDQRNTKKNPLSAGQRKNKSLAKVKSADEKMKSIVYATAVNIKKKGIRRTGFFDNTINSTFGQSFLESLSKVVGQDVKVIIRQANNNLNDKKE
jgi:hypothetical protein